MAVTIGATALLPGAGSLLANAALNLADDAVFAVLDVGGGYKSWEEAELEFGKKALNSAVNAITWDKEHGFGWSADAFNAGVQGGLISAATGMTSTFTSGMLGQMNLFDGNKLGLSDKIFNTESIKSFNSLAGSLAGQGVNYALTGDFALNVLNFGMFGVRDRENNLVQNGLLELHLGKKGVTINVGMGGADMSLGTIAGTMVGLSETISILRMRLGGIEGRSNLNAINQLGYTKNKENWELGIRIKTDKQGVEYEEIDGGLGTIRDGRIVLDTRLLGGGVEEAAQLAALMAHEDDHLQGFNEKHAYIREIQGFSDLQLQWGISGDRLISGIGEMAMDYRENGVEATLARLENQGLLGVESDERFTQQFLDKSTEDWITRRYGFDTALKLSVMASENVRALFAKNVAIREKELKTFLGGESKRLSTEASFRETELKKLVDVLNVQERFTNLSEADKKRLLEAGIDIDKCTSTGQTILQAAKAVLLKVGPIYLDMLLGQGVDRLAGGKGIDLPPGVAGITGNTIGEFLRTGNVSLPSLGSLCEDVFTDIVSSVIGQSFKGKDASRVGAVLDLFVADYQAAIEGFAFATKISGLVQEYRDARYTANLPPEQLFEMFIDKNKGIEIASQMASYQAAAQFMANGFTDIDQALMNQLKYCVTRLPAESLAPDAVQRAYKKGGYVGVFTPGNSDELLKMILSMTTDAQIYKSFKTTVYGFELYKGTVYVSGTTTNEKLNDIYMWRDNFKNRSYDNRVGWQWNPQGGMSWSR